MDDIAQQLTARLRQNPNDLAAYDQLKGHYQTVGDNVSLANLLEGWAGSCTEPEVASEAFREAAEAALGAGDRERAKALFHAAVHQSPLNYTAGERIQTLFEEDGDWAPLSEFLDGYLQLLEGGGGANEYMADLYFALGNVWAQRFERPDVATTQYLRAIELDPNHGHAAYAARAIAETSGDMATAAQFYEVEVRAEQDVERKLQLCAKLAELRADELNDLDGAVATLREALSTAPGDLEVMHSLGEYLLRRADAGDDPARDLQRAAELYYQIAQAVDEDQVVQYIEAALGALPSHQAALELLESTAPKVGRTELLPQYWIAFVDAVQTGVEADRRRVRLAQAYVDAGQLDDAIFSLEQASGPDAAKMLSSLKGGGQSQTVPPPRRAARQEQEQQQEQQEQEQEQEQEQQQQDVSQPVSASPEMADATPVPGEVASEASGPASVSVQVDESFRNLMDDAPTVAPEPTEEPEPEPEPEPERAAT